MEKCLGRDWHSGRGSMARLAAGTREEVCHPAESAGDTAPPTGLFPAGCSVLGSWSYVVGAYNDRLMCMLIYARNSFCMDDLDYQLQISSSGVKVALGWARLTVAVPQGSPCSPSQANAEGKKSPNKGFSWIQVHCRGATVFGIWQGAAKKGPGEGKGLHCRCFCPTVSSSTSSSTSAFHSHWNWFLAGILMVWIPIYQHMIIVDASYCTGPVVKVSVSQSQNFCHLDYSNEQEEVGFFHLCK